MSRAALSSGQNFPIAVTSLRTSGECRKLFSLALVLLAFVLYLLLLPQAVRGANWLTPTIYKSPASNGGATSPDINSAGQVVFHDANINQENVIEQRILRGDAVSVKTIMATSHLDATSPFIHLASEEINDSGDIAFWGMTPAAIGSGTKIVRFNESTQNFTEIAEGGYGLDFAWVNYPSINKVGDVAFWMSDTPAYNEKPTSWLGNGGDPVFMHAQPYTSMLRQSASPEVVIYREYGPGYETLYVYDNPPAKKIAEIPAANSIYEDFRTEDVGFLISENQIGGYTVGKVSHYSSGAEPVFAFIGDPVGGVEEALYVSTAGGTLPNLNPVVVADTSGYLDGIIDFSIAKPGVAFTATEDLTGLKSLYLASESALWNYTKILSEGDFLSGHASPVTDFSLTSQGMNDQGQIAVGVTFNDENWWPGRHEAIVRFDPFNLQQLYETANTVAVFKAEDSSYFSQPIYGSNGSEDLSFDYYFPGTTGQLAVTLGGELLAQIDAPGELVNGFTTFQMPVDIGQLFPDPVDQLLLQFSLTGVGETGVLFLDNIEFGRLVNGDFGTGNLAGWESTFFNDDSVGVAINPFYNAAAAVPEPAALLLALFGLALLPRGWRKKETARNA